MNLNKMLNNKSEEEIVFVTEEELLAFEVETKKAELAMQEAQMDMEEVFDSYLEFEKLVNVVEEEGLVPELYQMFVDKVKPYFDKFEIGNEEFAADGKMALIPHPTESNKPGMIKRAWEAVKKFFAKIWNWVSSFWKSTEKIATNLSALARTLPEEVDETKFNALTFNSIKYEYWGSINTDLVTLGKVAKKLEATDWKSIVTKLNANGRPNYTDVALQVGQKFDDAMKDNMPKTVDFKSFDINKDIKIEKLKPFDFNYPKYKEALKNNSLKAASVMTTDNGNKEAFKNIKKKVDKKSFGDENNVVASIVAKSLIGKFQKIAGAHAKLTILLGKALTTECKAVGMIKIK